MAVNQPKIKLVVNDVPNFTKSWSAYVGSTIEAAKEDTPETTDAIYRDIVDGGINVEQLNTTAARRFLYRQMVKKVARDHGSGNGVRIRQIGMQMTGIAAHLGNNLTSVKRSITTYKSLASILTPVQFEDQINALTVNMGAEGLRALQSLLDATNQVAINHGKKDGVDARLASVANSVRLLRDVLCAWLGPSLQEQQRLDTLQSACQQQIGALLSHLDVVTKTVEFRDESIQQKDVEIQTMNDTLAQRNTTILQANSTINDRDATAKDKDRRIAQLEARVEDLKKSNHYLYQKNLQLQRTCEPFVNCVSEGGCSDSDESVEGSNNVQWLAPGGGHYFTPCNGKKRKAGGGLSSSTC